MFSSKKSIKNLLEKADVKVNGNRDWDIQIHNEKFYSRVIGGGSLALGESYMDEWWDCKRIDLFIEKLLRAKLDEGLNIGTILLGIKSQILNLQSKSRASQVGEDHYDLGNELYKNMLGETMTYTCAYWKNSKNLKDAQNAKHGLICKKLKLKKGMRVLDIGCGFGEFARYASKKYGVNVVGISISKEQIKYAKNNCRGLPVEIKFLDYRSLNEKFDRIVSIEMFEAVGYKNFKTYFEIVEKCLKPQGLFVMQVIGQNSSSKVGNPWSDKYIFKNGMLPSIKQLGETTEKILIVEDWENLSTYYSKTLHEWEKNFVDNWEKLEKTYDKRFYRMWRYYLMSCAGSFQARHIQDWQIVFSRGDLKEKYIPIR